MRKTIRSVVLLAALAALSGCASFRSEVPGAAAAWPQAPDERASIAFTVEGDTVLNGSHDEMPARGKDKWREVTRRAYEESGLFGSVRRGEADTDYTAEIHVTNEGEFNQALAFISGFTFLVVPAKATDLLIVRTTFRDREGEIVGEIEKRSTMDSWIHLVMIPVMPFKFPFVEATKAMYDVQKATLIEADRQNIFESGPALAQDG